MKIIFLEIEGVLIHETSHVIARLLQKKLTAFKPSMDAFNFVTKATNAKVVITSSWRSMGMGILLNHFSTWGMETKNVDVTPIAAGKPEAIRKYIALIGKPDSFVIIDGEPIGDELFARYLVKTDPKLGD